VIPVEDDVHPDLLGLGGGATDGGVVGVLGLELGADASRTVGVRAVR
jgi:hypothetical protein